MSSSCLTDQTALLKIFKILCNKMNTKFFSDYLRWMHYIIIKILNINKYESLRKQIGTTKVLVITEAISSNVRKWSLEWTSFGCWIERTCREARSDQCTSNHKGLFGESNISTEHRRVHSTEMLQHHQLPFLSSLRNLPRLLSPLRYRLLSHQIATTARRLYRSNWEDHV